VVLCDQYRRHGLAFLVGATVFIDGILYNVVGADADQLAGPMNRGDRVMLWVERAAASRPEPTRELTSAFLR
jgi:hypothetical protein